VKELGEMPDQARFSDDVLVDAHVHVHPGFASDAFLDAAARNFRRAAAELGRQNGFLGCLLLTEMGTARWFRRMRNGEERAGMWSFERTGEAESLVAQRSGGDDGGGDRLLVIAGRQIATREGLEVLALAGDAEVRDGLPFGETLQRVRASGALPVLPWGFGKWWGRRGKLVAGALAHRGSAPLFLGDNAGRPAVGGEPPLFREARDRGVAVLPGSDPLPLPWHAGRAGSYGFLLEGGVSAEEPAGDLRRRIRELRESPRVFGRRVALPGFLRDQAALRDRRRFTVAQPGEGAAEVTP
jgi:hypothetical protein